MENLWKINFSPIEGKSPKAIFEEQSKYLEGMTKNRIYLDISPYPINKLAAELQMYDKPDAAFHFQVNVKSVVLNNYGFHILTYKHNIPFYPIEINLNPDIYKELFGSDDEKSIKLKDEAEFIRFIGQVFSTNIMGMVVNAILEMSN